MSLFSLFKRPEDSSEWNAIISATNGSIANRKTEVWPKISRGAVDRFYNKFGDTDLAIKYGIGIPFLNWGVLRHPMVNSGNPFTLRLNHKDELTFIEAASGEAWWLLTERLWLGRRGTAPGIPLSKTVDSGDGSGVKTVTAVDEVALLLLISQLSTEQETIELTSLSYARVSLFTDKYNFTAEWYSDYAGMRFFLNSGGLDFHVDLRTLDPSKGDESGVRLKAGRC